MMLLFINSLTLFAEKDSKEDVYITIVNEIQQSTDLKNNEKSLSCQRFFGDDLKKCLQYQSDENFKRQFFALHHRARMLYLLSLHCHEHEELLRRFTDAQEWHAWREKLSAQEKRFLPKTIKEQQEIIDEAREINYWQVYFDCIITAPSTKKGLSECKYDAIEARYKLVRQKLLQKYEEIIE